MNKSRSIILSLLISITLLLPACMISGGTVSGTVIDSQTTKPLAGVVITTDPPVKTELVETGQDGAYSLKLPQGIFAITFQKADYNQASETTTVLSKQQNTINIRLSPLAVTFNVGQDQISHPGGSVTLSVTAQPRDGSTILSYKWSQISGAPATLENPESDTVKVTLSDLAGYKKRLVDILQPEDRFAILSINPYALMSAATATFRVMVTTSSGIYSNNIRIFATIPFVTSAGIANTAIGTPVLLHGKNQTSFNWLLTSPGDSKSKLDSPAAQSPSFTPDLAGKYTVSEKNSGFTKDIYAGTWVGVITGEDRSGNLLAIDCLRCHNGFEAPDKFTSWKASGHASIFKNGLNSIEIYGEPCFSCHTVGFNKTAENGGFDDTTEYESFLGFFSSPDSENWRNMLSDFPKTARLANVQCESCHGPNAGSVLHPNLSFDAVRQSISPGVCGTCHGQPQGYGKLQQWEESSHAHFELAIEEGTVESRGATASHCGRCHSGQGFLTWIKQGDLTKQIQGARGNATPDELRSLGLTIGTVQPQTCAACHDPHQNTIIIGDKRTATRVMGNTGPLPAGFEATNAGYGAICITCHNTRNGLHNDENPPKNFSAPHSAAQGDAFMGENAYFVEQKKSPHSKIADSCVICHMQTIYPPSNARYEPPGKDHSFKANPNTCVSCHGNRIDIVSRKESHEKHLAELRDKIGQYLLTRLPDQISVKDFSPHEYANRPFDIKSDTIIISKDDIASAGPADSHGQQGFIFKLKNQVGVTYSPPGQSPHAIQAGEIQTQMADITIDGKTPVIPVTDVLVKVGWNYHLIHFDASGGFHNYDWEKEVIEMSLDALSSNQVK